MLELNARAADALRDFEPSAVTDVTGFGLLGHAHEVASASGVRVVLEASALPALPGALEAAEAGIRTGGDARNRDFAAAAVSLDGAGEAVVALAYDPQTAGGLLVALPSEKGGRPRSALAPTRSLPRSHRAGGGGRGSDAPLMEAARARRARRGPARSASPRRRSPGSPAPRWRLCSSSSSRARPCG